MYVIQLNNGEQHYVQASTVLSSTVQPTQSAITINPPVEHLHSPNAYLQTNQIEQQIQTIHPHQTQQQQQQQQQQQSSSQQHQHQQQTTVIQQQQQQQPTDTFQDVLDYIQQLYAELGKEKHLTHYFCLFCAQEFVDLRLLLRHTTTLHRLKILDGTINLEQDFEAIVRKKIDIKAQQQQQNQSHTANQQLYQCVQCQQMFSSLEVISDHLNHCPANIVQTASNTITNVPSMSATYSDMVKVEPLPSSHGNNGSSAKTHVIHPHEPYIPYGCAQCGHRYQTIRDLMAHMRNCRDETFYDAQNHLQQKNWVEAPKGQHIVINEESTNVVLKTTGLWLMPEPADSQMNSDTLRGFWVMPSSTTDYLEQQRREQMREQQEKLRIQQEQQRLLQEQQEKLRIQQEQKRLLELEKQRREQEIQRQLIEQQKQQQQQQQQQQQLLLQQQLQRQSQTSVVQTIATPNSVPLIKSSPTSVISQLNQANIQAPSTQSSSSANTIIVLNDDHQFLTQSGSDALRCIQASDGSYHVIGNVDLNEKVNVSNTTSVIAHTSPSIETATIATTARKKRGRTPKQNHIVYTQPNETEIIYETCEVPVVTKQTKRKRGTNIVNTTSTTATATNANDIPTTITIDSNQTVIQNVESPEVPSQQFYIAYNDNGVLVPIDSQTSIVKNDMNSGVMDLSQEQYIIEDLDASRKAQQQRIQNKSVTVTDNVTIAPAVQSTIQPNISKPSTARNRNQTAKTTTHTIQQPSATSVQQPKDDMVAYNIDDLSHLDKPIGTEKQAPIVPIKPLKTKPEFMDSFYTFLMNREANKL